MLNVYETFDIEKNTIKAKYKSSIKIIRDKYDEKMIKETNNQVVLPGILSFYIPHFDDFCQLVIPYQINLIKSDQTESDSKEIKIEYNKNDIIVKQKYVEDEVNIGLLNKILRGQIKYVNDPKILYNMIQNIIPNIESIYIESILSNMFRSSKDYSKKVRTTGNYKNATIVGVNNQPYYDSWEKSLAHERIDKALTHGLIKKPPSKKSKDPISMILRENYKSFN